MKEVYEIVKAEELRVGDVVKESAREYASTVRHVEVEDKCVLTNGGVPYGFKTAIFRQLPPERNPDVLKRALQIAVSEPRLHDRFDLLGWCMDKAIEELESEARQ